MCPTTTLTPPTFEVWDLPSGNLIDSFPTEKAAMAWLRQVLNDEGADYVRELALMRSDQEGRHILVEEDDLALRASLTPAGHDTTPWKMKRRQLHPLRLPARVTYMARSATASVRFHKREIAVTREVAPGIQVGLTRHGRIAAFRVKLPGIEGVSRVVPRALSKAGRAKRKVKPQRSTSKK